jgi:hypothetical protein
MIRDNMKTDGWDVEARNGSLIIIGHKGKDGSFSPVKGIGVAAPEHNENAQPSIGGVIRDIEIIDLNRR